MAMLNVLGMPVIILPLAVGKLVDLSVSLNRIQQFLLSPECETYLTEITDPNSHDAVVMRNATLQYRSVEDRSVRQTIMKDVNVTIPKGKLTLVVGPTGCGKSTLMTAMVGEGVVEEGTYIAKCGEIAYVTQEAWIMNATLRDNILMGKPYNEDKYVDVVSACQLMSDFEQLTGSDQTEVGERGVNLSGGQKQRIAFARAVYSGREIVLMDDPLSAVDSHVCSALFEQVITGLLSDRTRVLVTHQTQFLPTADYIIVVQDRKVTFAGTYGELQNANIDLSTIIETPSGSPNNERHGAPLLANPVARAPAGKRPQIPRPQSEDAKALMSTEIQTVGAVSGDVYLWYGSLSGWGNMFWILITFSICRAVMCFSDLIVSWWSTRKPVVGQTLTQDQYLYWYAIFVGLSMLFLAIRQVPFVWAIAKVAGSSHGKLLHNVLNAPSSFFDTTPTGRRINRFSKDMEAIDLVIPESLNLFYSLLLVVLGLMGVMIYSAYYLAIILVVLIVLFAVLFRYYLATNRALKRLEASGRSPLLAIMNETLGGLPTIRAYGIADDFSRRHVARLDASARSSYSWRVSQRWLNCRSDWISCTINVATGVIVLLMLFSMSQSSRMTNVGTLSLAITYSLSISEAIGFLTVMTADLEAAMSSVERVKEYVEDIPQEKVVVYGTGPEDVHQPNSTWPDKGRVSIANLDVRYRPNLPLVLMSLSCEIQAGQHIGVVGRTGSGKSTIMLTLFRMVEAAGGCIMIDGVDISKLSMYDLRSKLTILPQDPVLFAGTIRSNLDPFARFSEDEVWNSISRVGMMERVKLDNKGLECPVAERGSNFSVGQRQLLCLARAMLKRTKILLMDEATASVDFESDAMIQRTIREEFTECTVITIAHRLATIIDYDLVLVMDQGVKLEYDSPDRLLRSTSTHFYGMVKQLGEEQCAELIHAANEAAKKREAKAKRLLFRFTL